MLLFIVVGKVRIAPIVLSHERSLNCTNEFPPYCEYTLCSLNFYQRGIQNIITFYSKSYVFLVPIKSLFSFSRIPNSTWAFSISSVGPGSNCFGFHNPDLKVYFFPLPSCCLNAWSSELTISLGRRRNNIKNISRLSLIGCSVWTQLFWALLTVVNVFCFVLV